MSSESEGYKSHSPSSEVDYAETEAHLYSLIHHCPVEEPNQQNTSDITPSPDLRINPFSSNTSLQNIKTPEVSNPTVSNDVVTTPNISQPIYESSWNKASRLNAVHNIISSAEHSQHKEVNKQKVKKNKKKNKLGRNINLTFPITPSSSMHNLPNGIVNTSRQKRRVLVSPKSHLLSVEIRQNLPNKERSLINSFSFDLSTHFDATSRVHSMHETFHKSNRLFSQSSFTVNADKNPSRKMFWCEDYVPEEITIADEDPPNQTSGNTSNDIITIEDSEEESKDTKLSKTPDIESDSDESIFVLPAPPKVEPVVLSIEESSEDEAPMGPPPVPDIQENSFDFLDNSHDVDAIARAQATLMSTLIGSRESLNDERIFQHLSNNEDTPGKKISSKRQAKTRKTVVTAESPESSKINVQSTKETVEVITDNVPPTVDVEVTCNVDVKFSGFPPKEKNVSKKKTPKKNPAGTSRKTEVPTLYIDSGKRQELLSYIDARLKGDIPPQTSNAGPSNQSDNKPSTSATSSAVREDILAVHSGTVEECITIDDILNKSKSGEDKQSRHSGKKLKRKMTSKPMFSLTPIEGPELVGREFRGSRNPSSWTKAMKKFYNESWGGEDFDVHTTKDNMPYNPVLWQCYPASMWRRNGGGGNRCGSCMGRHHSLSCPQRVPACIMCGVRGHNSDHCPQSMCLQCGTTNAQFVEYCNRCRYVEYNNRHRSSQSNYNKRSRIQEPYFDRSRSGSSYRRNSRRTFWYDDNR